MLYYIILNYILLLLNYIGIPFNQVVYTVLF
jgi:hypothetical protein